jgi:type VI secretion system secreted protein Hcp
MADVAANSCGQKFSRGVRMAIDVYLKIDGIMGESRDDTHMGWIECLSVEWKLLQPRSATASTGGGHSVERCELSDVVIKKYSDVATPILLQTCAAGKTIARATLQCLRADGQGIRVRYFEIELENVLIGDVILDLHEGDLLSEHVGLKFSKVRWTYSKQNVSGGIAGNTVGGWDLATNRIA